WASGAGTSPAGSGGCRGCRSRLRKVNGLPLRDAAHVEWEPIVGSGYTRARKWRATLDDGTRLFAKEAGAAEIVVYEAVRRDFLPKLHDVRGEVLLLEDLSAAHWPPPYPDDCAALLAALDEVAATAPPAQLPRLTEASAWAAIAAEPRPLLALGLCSARWLEHALPLLIEAEARLPRFGSGLVPNRVWAANLCLPGRCVVLVDWSEARTGKPRIDLAFALFTSCRGRLDAATRRRGGARRFRDRDRRDRGVGGAARVGSRRRAATRGSEGRSRRRPTLGRATD